MADLFRPSFSLADNSNPFRRYNQSRKNFYVQIRKFVLKNTRGTFRGSLNVSGPKEVIGIFANYIFKLCQSCQHNINKLKSLKESSADLPPVSKVLKNLLSPSKKTTEVLKTSFTPLGTLSPANPIQIHRVKERNHHRST